MNHISLFVTASLLALGGAGIAQDFGDLEKKADEVAIVTVNSNTLHALLHLVSDEKGEDAELAHALANISDISVRSLSFHDHRMPSEEEITSVRARVIPAGWPRFLSSRSKDPDEVVEGYLGPEGMALLTWQPGEVTSVRIRGSVPAASVPALGRHFGIPALRQGMVIEPPGGKPSAFALPPAGPPPAKLNFNALVRDVESREGIQHMHIPLFGLIRPVAFMASSGTVRALDMAIFEDAPSDFARAVEQSIPFGWSKLVEVRQHGESTGVYVGDVGSSIHLIIANRDGSEGVLLTTKVNVRQLCQNPSVWARGQHHDADSDEQ